MVYDNNMKIQTTKNIEEVSLAIEFHFLSYVSCRNGVIYQGKYIKWDSKCKWTNSEYNSQNKEDVNHDYVKISCDTSQFLVFPCCGSHSKPHGFQGLSKKYHL